MSMCHADSSKSKGSGTEADISDFVGGFLWFTMKEWWDNDNEVYYREHTLMKQGFCDIFDLVNMYTWILNINYWA